MSSQPPETTRRDGDAATPAPRLDTSALIGEIERYLAAVALYRELGCQPTWICEWAGESAAEREEEEQCAPSR
jgi:hypothetical protein